MNKYAMSVAVMALLGVSAPVNAHKHRHHHHHTPMRGDYVQFIDGDEDFNDMAIAQAKRIGDSS